MTALIWAGVALSVTGLAGLFWCIAQALGARRSDLDDTALRARLQRLVVWNLGALLLSMLGLMLVIVGGILS